MPNPSRSGYAFVTVMGGTGSGVEKNMMGGNVYNAGGYECQAGGMTLLVR